MRSTIAVGAIDCCVSSAAFAMTALFGLMASANDSPLNEPMSSQDAFNPSSRNQGCVNTIVIEPRNSGSGGISASFLNGSRLRIVNLILTGSYVASLQFAQVTS